MRIGGLASGFDTENIVKDLMRAERLPLDRVFQQKIRTEWQRDQYRTLSTKIAGFRNIVFDMQLQSGFNVKTALTTNENVLSVRTTGSAQVGSYNLLVKELATSANLITATGVKERFEDFTGGITEPMYIRIRSSHKNSEGEPTEFMDIEINPGETVDSFVQKVNTNKELKTSALYDQFTDSLVFTSTDTGENTEIQFDLANTETENFVIQVLQDELGYWSKNGTNAKIVINGLETERESNVFNLAGIEVTLKSSSQEVIKIDVSQDTDEIVNNIKNFVQQYNELIDEIHGKLTESFYRDFPPLTDEQKENMSERDIELWEEKAQSGLLRSDKILSDLVYSMRRALTTPVEGVDDDLNNLHQIGITTGSWYENGKLYINEQKLRTAIEENLDQVTELFTRNSEGSTSGEPGLARRLNASLEAGLDRLANTAGKSTALYDKSTLSEKIRRYDDQILAMEERLIKVENRYWAQFSMMEKLLQEMYSQSDWLYQQLGLMTM